MHVKVLLVIAIITLVSSTIVSYLNSEDIIFGENDVAESYATLQNLEKLLSTMLDAETGRRGYYITEEKEFLTSYKEASNTIDTIYSRIRKLTGHSAMQQVYLDTLAGIIKEKFSLFEQSIRLQETKGTSYKLHKSLFERGGDLQIAMRRIVDSMKKEERRELTKRQQISLRSSEFATYGLVGGVGFAILLLIIAFALMSKLSLRRNADTGRQGMSIDELETLLRDRTAEISQLSIRLNQKSSEIERLKGTLALFEQSYRSLFDLSHDAILVLEPDSEKVLDLNTKATEMYGIKREEFIGRSMRFLLKNAPAGEENIKQILKKGLHTFQTVHYKKDGTEMLLEVNATVINYKGSKAILAINREITDRVFQVV
jgi:PAS domain S-box-containing protein